MTNAHETPYHLTYTDSSIALPIQRPEHGFYPSEASCEQSHNRQVDAQKRDTTRTHAFYSDNGHTPTSVSPESDVILPADIEYLGTSTSPQAERSSAYITDPSIDERIQRNDSQDKRPEAVSHIPLTGQDADSDTPTNAAPRMNDEFCPGKDCPTRRDFCSPRLTWVNGTIVFISSVSTALSAVFVYLALKGQRYGDYIGNDPGAKLSISAAILWTAVVAKTIEISFVTAFVAFLGQVLSRRAFFDSKDRGVTLSELTMWRWVVQPGTVISQSEIARYSGLSFLGILTLLSTVMSTLYVTAATALVQPIPRQSNWHDKVMSGSVKTDFANLNYIQSRCQLPVNDTVDGPDSCLQIEYAGKSFYNLAKFLAHWDDTVKTSDRVPIDQNYRPTLIGLPYGNTTVRPQWIDVSDTTDVSRKYGRAISNVSLAMPHIGVSNAVLDQMNVMPRSETADSVKAYSLWASVPSPVMKVLCASLAQTELEPIVYSYWSGSDEPVNVASWDIQQVNATSSNRTVVDEIFGWGEENYTSVNDFPPVFSRLPGVYNTIINYTIWTTERPAIYLLGQGGPTDDGIDTTGVYSLCKLEVNITPDCSTRHTVSVSGSKVEALCGEDRAGDMSYSMTKPSTSTARAIGSWRDVGLQWASSLQLNSPVEDLNSRHAKLLMMLPLSNRLDHLPSLAETLAVTASDTLLTCLQDAPFADDWNHTSPSLDIWETQQFKARIQSQEYASGGVDNASKGWLAVLLCTLLVNILMLVYFVLQPGLVTDFSQPPQLFALAVNSPPARAFAGSCGSGPEGKEYKICWSVGSEGGHVYIEPKSALLTEDSGLDRKPPHQGLNQETPKDDGFYYTIIAAFSRMKLKWKSVTQRPIRRSTSSGAEPLRSLYTT